MPVLPFVGTHGTPAPKFPLEFDSQLLPRKRALAPPLCLMHERQSSNCLSLATLYLIQDPKKPSQKGRTGQMEAD